LRQIQRMDPVGVGARDLAGCLWIQLDTLPAQTPGRALAMTVARTLIDRLPKLGVRGVCEQLGCTTEEAETALALLRSLDPRPGSQVGELTSDSYVVPDAVIVRRNGVWQAMLAPHSMPRLTIHQAYERMIQTAAGDDAGYLKGRLQEARWLLKNLEVAGIVAGDRKSTRLNSSHVKISYAVFCLKKKRRSETATALRHVAA